MKRKAQKMGLCGEYEQRWNNAVSNADLINIVTDINGADFLCSGISKGWSVSIDYIKSHFAQYINGRKTLYHNGYKSSIYVDHNETIVCKTTVVIIISSRCDVHIPKNNYCEIFIAGDDTDININAEGMAYIHVYNGKVNINQQYLSKNVKIINPKDDKNSWLNF